MSAQDCVLVGFEQLQDKLPGQPDPFPSHSPTNKLRACFWTGVLDLGFFSIMLNGIFYISTCTRFLPGQNLELDQGRCLRGKQQKLLGV